MRMRKMPGLTMALILALLGAAGCQKRDEKQTESPQGRGYHAMAYDTESRRAILFGGQTGDSGNYPEVFLSAETWAYDPAENLWQKMSPPASPPAMAAQAMAYDSESDRVILHGGGGASERLEDAVLNQTWAYDLNSDTWAKMSDGPSRLGHRMVYDAESDRIVMFSGACFQNGRFQDVQETWAYDFNADTWTEMKPSVSPAARHYHGMAYDKNSDMAILWGGFLGKTITDARIWAYDFNSNSWSERKPASGLDPRWYHALAYDDASDRIVVFGGMDDGNADTWAYDSNCNSWAKIDTPDTPGKLSRMPMVYVPELRRMVLFGGQLDSRRFTYSDETWIYDPQSNVWANKTVRKGEYFGQRKPGLIPEVFAPGIVSTVYLEHSPVAFSPDGKEAFWTRDFRGFGTTEGRIFYTTQKNEKWTPPRVASFSENLNCYNPVFSDDGNEIYYFAQPLEDTKKPVPKIYKVERQKKGWSEPSLVEIPGMKGYLMTQFSLAKDETLYFSTDSEDGKGSFDIYRSRLVKGRYSEPENLGDSINGPYWDSYPYIDRQERFLIFTSVGRPDGHGGLDLYISFRKDDGSWMESVNMGDRINTKGVEGLVNLSPDGKWMFFISDRNGNVDVYWVDAKIIEELRPKGL